MANLDNRRLEILDKMGIDVWCLRKRSGDKPGQDSFDAGSEKTDQADQTGDRNISVAGSSLEENPESVISDFDSLDDIALQICQCEKCPLQASRTKAVPGVGYANSAWMFVGEAPGQNEDQRGEPFVGRAGQLLDAMIAALQMQRSQAFIANVIKCRPPGNRDPLAEEITQCEPYLHQQLKLVQPKVIVALGRISAQALLKSSKPLGHLRGKVHHYGSTSTPLVVTYHPAYLLRSPQQKSKSWQDLLLAKSVVSGQ